uniref:Uncharacterized protein n=1 Tax=Kalanchoe fedtschenkoi TaxID=63787 RepID=A0A7N0ZUV3_KALFE
MLKQSPSRNQRAARGACKVKHVAQMCLMLAVTLWMLYQLRHCYFKKAALLEEKMGGGVRSVVKLGRKGLLPGVVDDEELKGDANEEEEVRGDELEQQVDDLMEEIEEQETEDKENQSEDALVNEDKLHQQE